MTIKQGAVLKGKDGGYDATYQGNVGDAHFVVDKEGIAFVYSTQELQERYELPKEQWVPEKGDTCWIILAQGEDGIGWIIWAGSEWDKAMLANGLAFKTREEALDAVKRVRGDV